MFKESLIQILIFIVLEIAKTQDHGHGYSWGAILESRCIIVIVVYKYLPILLYGILFTIHTALDVAHPKLPVPRPEIVSASSSIPVLAKPLALNGVLCSGGLGIVDVMAIIGGVVFKADFMFLRSCWPRGLRWRRLPFLLILRFLLCKKSAKPEFPQICLRMV